MKVDANLQPHLGRVKTNYKPQNNMGGYMTVAKVIKIHHKHNTVDLQIIRSNDTVTSSSENEGMFGARVLTASAHYDRSLLSSSGVVEPLQEGQLVILGFLDGFKNQPIVLGSFHETWRPEHNVLTPDYPLRPDRIMDDYRESLKYLRVTPSQMYHKVDGIGAVEMSLPSKTFLKIDPDFIGNLDDTHKGFDHTDLTEKDPVNPDNTRYGKTEEALLPVKVLFTHRTSFHDPDTTWTKFFIDTDGMYRVTRDNNDGKLTYTEGTAEGGWKLRRQLDSDLHGQGDNFVEVDVTEDGSIKIQKNLNGISSIEIDKDNNIILKQRSGSYIRMDDNGDIIIRAERYLHTSQGGA